MTIGELEREAGIGPAKKDRFAFWIQFKDLDSRAAIDAGVAELRRRIGEAPKTAKQGRAS